MTAVGRPIDCSRLFQTDVCQKICKEVQEEFAFLFEEWEGVVVSSSEYPYPPYECEFVIQIRNGILFRFWGDYGGWVWFLKLPFKHRQGGTSWTTPDSILDYVNRQPPRFRENPPSLEEDRQQIETVIEFYESEDFRRFEEEYEEWNAWYEQELDKLFGERQAKEDTEE